MNKYTNDVFLEVNYLSHVDGSRMAVVESDAMEHTSSFFDVFAHQVPQVWGIFWSLTIAVGDKSDK